MNSFLQTQGVFLLFAIFSIVGGFFAVACIRETKGLSDL